MTSEIVSPVRSDKVQLDNTKIQRHRVPITGLELKLDEVGGRYEATIVLNGYGQTTFKELGQNRAKALRQYQDLLMAFERGEYSFDLYDNGKIEVTFPE